MSWWCRLGLHRMSEWVYEGSIVLSRIGLKQSSDNTWKRGRIRFKRDIFFRKCKGCAVFEYNFKNH